MTLSDAHESAVKLQRLTALVVNQVSHWSQERWGTLAGDLHAIVQRIAGPKYEMPELGPVALPDQLRVVVADLIVEGDPERLGQAVEDLAGFRDRLTTSQ